MTIETLNLVLSIGEIIGSTILLAYLWKKTDWKRVREFERFMRTTDWDKLPEKPRAQN